MADLNSLITNILTSPKDRLVIGKNKYGNYTSIYRKWYGFGPLIAVNHYTLEEVLLEISSTKNTRGF
jgi:hypothetical protein